MRKLLKFDHGHKMDAQFRTCATKTAADWSANGNSQISVECLRSVYATAMREAATLPLNPPVDTRAVFANNELDLAEIEVGEQLIFLIWYISV